MKFLRRLRNLFRGREGTPEDELAEFEAKELKKKLKRVTPPRAGGDDRPRV